MCIKIDREMKKKQRSVLFISELDIWSLGKGKGGPALYRTLTGYAERGWKVLFITGNRCLEACESPHANIRIIRFDATWLRNLMRKKKIGFFAKILWWIYFQITAFHKAINVKRENQIGVVYGYEIYGVPVAKLLSILWGIPMVARFQGTSLGFGWRNKKFRGLRAWEHLLAFRIPADLVIMTNDGTQGNKILKQLRVNMQRVRFWMNGVDWILFENLLATNDAKRVLNINSEKMLLTVSRLVRWKRVDRSIEALPEVVRAHPDTILIIVGEGPERARLEQLAQQLGVKEHVRFEGAIPHSEIPKYMAAADIFLSFYDGSNVGNPLLEAMMSGKCIVTLNNGDTGRFIKDGENGILLEHEDLPELPRVLNALLADEDLRRRLGDNAKKFAQEHFWSWEERLNAEIKEVERLLNG